MPRGRLEYEATLTTKGFRAGASVVDRELESMSDKWERWNDQQKRYKGINKRSGGLAGDVFLGNLYTIGIQKAGQALIGFKDLLVESAQAGAKHKETLEIFENLTGTLAEAEGLVNSIDTFAPAGTRGEFQAGARKLLPTAGDTQQVSVTLGRIGDVALATGSKVNELAAIYTKVQATGVLSMEEINQMGDRGIPIYEELARVLSEDLGRAIQSSDIKSLAAGGQINFSHIEKAFQNMTNEGGRFHGVLKGQNALAGEFFKNIKAAGEEVSRSFGASTLDAWLGDATEANNNLLVLKDTFAAVAEEAGNVAGTVLAMFSEIASGAGDAPNILTLGLGGLFDAQKQLREADEAWEDFKRRNEDRLFEQQEGVSKVVAEVLKLREEWRTAADEVLDNVEVQIRTGDARNELKELFGTQPVENYRSQVQLLERQMLNLQQAIAAGLQPFGVSLNSFRDMERVQEAVNNTFDRSQASDAEQQRHAVQSLLDTLVDVQSKTRELNAEMMESATEAQRERFEFEAAVRLAQARGDRGQVRALERQRLVEQFRGDDLPQEAAEEAADRQIALQAKLEAIESQNARKQHERQRERIELEEQLEEALLAGKVEQFRILELERQRAIAKEELVQLSDEEADKLQRVLDTTGQLTEEDRTRLAQRKEELAAAEKLAQRRAERGQIRDLSNLGLDPRDIDQLSFESKVRLETADLESARGVQETIEDLRKNAVGGAGDEAAATARITAELREQLEVLKQIERQERKEGRGRQDKPIKSFTPEESEQRRRDRISPRQLEDELERERFFAGPNPNEEERKRIKELEDQLNRNLDARGDTRTPEERERQREEDRKPQFSGLDELEKLQKEGNEEQKKQGEEQAPDLSDEQREDRAPDVEPLPVDRTPLPVEPIPPLRVQVDPIRVTADPASTVQASALSELVSLARSRNQSLVSIDETLKNRLPEEAA